MTGDILARLQAAQSDEEREWLVTEFSLANLEPPVRNAVWAAAIPLWFDVAYLAALLDKQVNETRPIFDQLVTLSFIEPFSDRGHNVHERTRALLLSRLWRDDNERFRNMSRRAADFCARHDQSDTAWRVETIYHQLLGDVPHAIAVFVEQAVNWHDEFKFEKVEALIRPLLNAFHVGRLNGRAAAWVCFLRGRLDVIFGHITDAKSALSVATRLDHEDETLRAHCTRSLGDVHFSLSEYSEARVRYEEALPIYRAIGSRMGEANCIKALGDVYVGLAEFGEARVRYEEALLIYQAIGSRMDEANCIKALGDVHIGLSKSEEARTFFEEALSIYRSVGDQLGEANCIKALGDIHIRLAEDQYARMRYEEALSYYRDIVEHASSHNSYVVQRAGREFARMTNRDGVRAVVRDEIVIAPIYALDLPEAWPITSDLLVALAPRLEPATYLRLFGIEAYRDRLVGVLLNDAPPWIVVLDGVGGIGKTSLADATARAVTRQRLDVEVAWVSARQQRFDIGGVVRHVDQPALTVNSLLEALSRQLLPGTPPVTSSEGAISVLRAAFDEHPTLVVIDNLETVTDVESLLPVMHRLAGPAKFVLTSRHSLLGQAGVFHLRVPELGEPDALSLVRLEAEQRNLPELAGASDAELHRIYQIVGGNPLALRLVAGQSRVHSLSRFLGDLQAARGTSLETLYSFIFRWAWDNLSEKPRRALLAMPLVTERGENVANLAQLSGLAVGELSDALTELVMLSLVDGRGGALDRRYTIHNLTRTFLLEQVIRWQ